MKSFLQILFCLILISLTACEGKTLTEKKIINNSGQQITFEITYKSGDIKEHIAEPNSTVTISSIDELGGKKDIGGCTEPIEKIKTLISLGRTLSFNPIDESRWKKTSEKTKKLPATYHHECILTINNDDIQ